MVPSENPEQPLGLDVRIPYRGLDVFVSKEFLHVADACPVVKEMGRGGMPYGMSGDFRAVHIEFPQVLPEDPAYMGSPHGLVEALRPQSEKNVVINLVQALSQIFFQETGRALCERNNPVTVEFSPDYCLPVLKVNVSDS